ncbi:MAG: thiosulfohydrolase SoxB [Rhodospirillaceae bacterium]|nr:thiosulfohydrolase SoxB [Rhodospirillaceae bacterium]
MFDRRGFLQVAMAAASFTAAGSVGRAAAAQKITQEELLKFDSLGQVTLLHFTDIHAQLKPVFFREPPENFGVGDVRGLPPHVSGQALLDMYGLRAGSPESYALSSQDFVALGREYGRIGGLDRMATLIKAIRAERPGKTILLDGGDTWQGSYTSLKSKGADMVTAMNELGVEAMTAHWEFTHGAEQVKSLIETLKFPFLAGNIRDTTWEEAVFDAETVFERGGVRVAVIGQAYPYTPIANPRYMMPNWSFGIQEKLVRARVEKARASGADVVVLLSHNGFDIDRKLAARVPGIDVILTGHTHDALPRPVTVGKTLLIASGSHGKFLSRLDLDVKNKRVVGYKFKLIPVFADAITPDKAMASVIDDIRAPHEKHLNEVLGQSESLLYRRGNFNGTFDDLICQALLEERDAQISLSPGFRWGATLLPGQDIRREDIYNQTAITYPKAYRSEFTGQFLKEILEDVADNLFNVDPYYQQGGDMVRSGNLGYAIDVSKPMGGRISGMHLISTGEGIDASKSYVVSGWASVNEAVQGPPVYDLVSQYVERHKSIQIKPNTNIKVTGA